MAKRFSPYWRPWHRPLFFTTTHKRVRSSRYAQPGHRPRRRTRFNQGGRLRYLAGRRTLARQCRALGFAHVGRGVWYDPAADCAYAGGVSW